MYGRRLTALAVAIVGVGVSGSAHADTSAVCHLAIHVVQEAGGYRSDVGPAQCLGQLGNRVATPQLTSSATLDRPVGRRGCAGPDSGRLLILGPHPMSLAPYAEAVYLDGRFTTSELDPVTKPLTGSGTSDTDAVALTGAAIWSPDEPGVCGGAGTLRLEIALTRSGPRTESSPPTAQPDRTQRTSARHRRGHSRHHRRRGRHRARSRRRR